MDRSIEILTTVTRGFYLFGPGKFRHRHLQAAAVLQSPYFPSDERDEYLDDLFKAVTDPHSSLFPKFLTKLFHEKPPPPRDQPADAPPADLDAIAVVTRACRAAFELHGARSAEPPVLVKE